MANRRGFQRGVELNQRMTKEFERLGDIVARTARLVTGKAPNATGSGVERRDGQTT